MKTFVAICKGTAISGSLLLCQQWANGKINSDNQAIVKFLRVKPKEDSFVFAEMDNTGFQLTKDPRTKIKYFKILKVLEDG